MLHDLGLGVFAFDYRGFGQSDPTRPNQIRMTEDAAHALQYLNESRHIESSSIVVYGEGLGASLATHLAEGHGNLAALILESPGSATIATALADPRTRALPVRLLFHEDFSLTPLQTLRTPKLLISSETSGSIPDTFRNAADPKTTVELPAGNKQALPTSIAAFSISFRGKTWRLRSEGARYSGRLTKGWELHCR